MSGRAGFERVAILGLGLLGGSVGLAARSRRAAGRVVGSSRRRESLDAALALGAVDEAHADPAVAVRDADLVVLATPPFAMAGLVRSVSEALSTGAIVTDVGSVKAPVAEVLPGLLPPGVDYVGAHPMAGSHRKGVAHARAELFEGAACVLTPTRSSKPEAVERLADFFGALGARVVVRDPETHDEEVGWVSHLPHALAFAFARALAGAPSGAAELRGPGFRDFTRIAHGDPELWAEILGSNAKALAGPLQQTLERLAELARLLDAGDGDALERFIGEARARLSPDLDAARGGGRARSSNDET